MSGKATASHRRTKSADLATAHHEAGHAVAAWQSKGLRAVEKISIESGEGSSGSSQSKWLLKGRNPEFEMNGKIRDRVESEILVGLSGMAAQRKYNRRSARSHHDSGDREKAVGLAMYVAGEGEGLEAYLHWMNLRALGLVNRFWPVVVDLAKTLIVRRKMTGKELRQWLFDWDITKLRGKRESRRE
jgi:hypothetical protein